MQKEITAKIDGLNICLYVEEDLIDNINKNLHRKIDRITLIGTLTPFLTNIYNSKAKKVIVADGDFNISLIVKTNISDNKLILEIENFINNNDVYLVRGIKTTTINKVFD